MNPRHKNQGMTLVLDSRKKNVDTKKLPKKSLFTLGYLF